MDEGEQPRDWKNRSLSVGAPIASIKCQKLGGNYTGSHMNFKVKVLNQDIVQDCGAHLLHQGNLVLIKHVFKNFGNCLRQNHLAG